MPASLAIVGPVLVLLAALLADPLGALLLACCGLLVPVAMAAAGIGAAAASRGQFLALARLQARFLDRVRGIATIVLFGRRSGGAVAGRAADELATAHDACAARRLSVVGRARSCRGLGDRHAGAALWPGCCGRLRCRHPARPLFVLLLVPEFFAPLRSFAAAYQDRLHATGAAEALVDLPPLPEPAPPREVRTVPARGIAVAFRMCTSPGTRRAARRWTGCRSACRTGETLVLAGPSGAGKSTVIEILLGFVRPDSGRVTINGADITDLVPQALARLTAWIGQRPVLFAGTIRDNIRFARPEATEQEVAEAARATPGWTASPRRCRMGWTPGRGGGLWPVRRPGPAHRDRPRLSEECPLLLLDEPTAHLDPATEAEVLDSLRRLALGRTVILASHSSAAHAFGGRRLDIRDGRAVPARGVA